MWMRKSKAKGEGGRGKTENWDSPLNYFSLCILNLFNTRVSQFEFNYWNKWTFPRHSNLLRCTCTYLTACFATVSKRNVHWVVLKHRCISYPIKASNTANVERPDYIHTILFLGLQNNYLFRKVPTQRSMWFRMQPLSYPMAQICGEDFFFISNQWHIGVFLSWFHTGFPFPSNSW